VWEARIAAVLLLVVLGLVLGLVMVLLVLLLIVMMLLRQRRLLLLLLAVLVVTSRMLHHRIESFVHASDSSCAARGRAVRGEVFALRIRKSGLSCWSESSCQGRCWDVGWWAHG